jgi:hypothetical protein
MAGGKAAGEAAPSLAGGGEATGEAAPFLADRREAEAEGGEEPVSGDC